jgi:hypothetical protein
MDHAACTTWKDAAARLRAVRAPKPPAEMSWAESAALVGYPPELADPEHDRPLAHA